MKTHIFRTIKRKRKSTFLIFLVSSIALFTSCKEPSIKTILNPCISQISGDNENRLSIDKVILTDAMTIIDFAYDTKNGACAFISPDSYIQANGKKYKLTGTKNIFTVDRTAELVHFKKVTFSLIFQPIPKNTKSIDFYESDNGWKIKSIDLETNSSTINYDSLAAGNIYVATIDSIIELQQQTQQRQRENSYTHPHKPQSYGYTQDNTEYYYFCSKCKTLVTASKLNEPRPNSGQCIGGYHFWYCYGKVGNSLYQCSKCGMSLKTNGRPTGELGCPSDTHKRHSWVQRY